MTAAGRRPRFGIRSWALSVGLALAIVGFVAAAQWNSSAERQSFATTAQQVLTSRVVELEELQADLREQIEAEEAKLQQFQERDAGSQAALEALNERVQDAHIVAGTSELRGPGAVIEISDSLRVIPAGDNRTNYLVLEDDLQDIITALWAAGAEAIAVNGERLVSTSSVYGAGAAILINNTRHAPPYRFEAIGSDGLLERFLAHPAFRGSVALRIETYGLEFATEASDELVLPAFVGSTAFRWGVAVEDEP